MNLLTPILLSSLAIAACAADPVKIMPLGDSITQGNTQQDSYRRPLWHKLKDAGFTVDFVGSEATNFTGHAAHPDFDEDNEGHYGWKITGVLPKLDEWLDKNTPDIVLLHLGTNDQDKAPVILANLEQVIVKLRTHNPKVTVLFAQLITNWGELAEVNKAIPDLAKKLTTDQSRIIVVDQASGFIYPGDSVDGCHPNAVGEEKMAVKWFDALKPLLSKPGAPGAGAPAPGDATDIQEFAKQVKAQKTEPLRQAFIDKELIGKDCSLTGKIVRYKEVTVHRESGKGKENAMIVKVGSDECGVLMEDLDLKKPPYPVGGVVSVTGTINARDDSAMLLVKSSGKIMGPAPKK